MLSISSNKPGNKFIYFDELDHIKILSSRIKFVYNDGEIIFWTYKQRENKLLDEDKIKIANSIFYKRVRKVVDVMY